MKKNIHPHYQSKINIYTNGSTYLSNVPLLVKDFMGDQISDLGTSPKDLSNLVSNVQAKLKKSNFSISSLGEKSFRIKNIKVFGSEA
jgi:hypothetical protein